MNLEERIIEYIKNNPIENDGKTLSIENLSIKIPDISIDNQLLLKLKGEGSLEGVIKGKVLIKDSLTKASISEGNTMNIMKFPIKTERGTYIINGTEKNVLNQMRLKSGCYSTRDSASNKIKTNFTFARPRNKMYMPQLSFILNVSKSPQFTVSIKKASKEVNFNILNFLWILGFTDQEVEEILGKGQLAMSLIEKYAKKVNAHSPRKLLGVLIGNEASVANFTDDQARNQIWNFINNSAKFDEEVVKSTIGVQTSTLDKQSIKNAVSKTIALAENSEQQDDNKDDLKFKTIDSDDDLMFEQFLKSYDSFSNTATSLLGNKNLNAKTFLAVTKLGDGLKEFLSKSSLVQTPEEINPLFLDTMNRKITQMGDGGLTKDSSRKEVNARNLTMSAINKIDPVETPESINIGLVQHLTNGVEIDNGTLKIKVFKVNNGIADKKNPVKLSSIEEEDKIIAYYDTRYMEDNNGKIKFTKPLVPCRFKGDTKDFPIKEIQYVDTSSTNLLGTAVNMIPFVMHDDGARAMMGAKMQTQATSIKNKEVPLVSAVADKETGETFEQKVGREFSKPILATVEGVVESIENSKIIIRDKKNNQHSYNYYRYYPLTQSYMNNELKVKVGDIVQPGDILAEGWQTKDGSLALGLNTRVGYLSYKGYNYEDGVVISKKYADRMASEDVNTYDIEIPINANGGVGSNVLEELKKYTTDSAILKLDKDGIIQEGEYVKAGNIVAAILVPLEGNSSLLDQIMNDGKPAQGWKLRPIAIDSNSYVGGKIVRKTIIDNPTSSMKQKIVLTLLKSESLKVGDKIAGRHGNKGTITKILDDKLMPVSEDGKPFELLFSPLAIPSRKNTGQIFEVNAGLIAEKTGKQFKVENFDFSQKDKVLNQLKELGYEGGKMKVTLKEEDENGNIISIKGENPVTTGNMYVMKLKHKVDDKVQSRSNFEGPGISSREKMPTKTIGAAAGEKHNPQSIGEMEMRALQGHNAIWNILEATTIKADGGGGREERIALFRALSTGKIEGEDLKNQSTTPETVKIMSDKLKGLGLNLKPYYKGRVVGSLSQPFDAIGIAPLNSQDFLKNIGPQHEITKHTDFLNARSLYNEGGKKESEKTYITGGLMDPEIFGELNEEESRSKWGYIKLATPVPNPILLSDNSYNPYSILTGIKRTDLINIVTGKAIVVGNEVDIKNSLEGMPEELKVEYTKEMLNNMQELGYKTGDIIKVSDFEKNVSSKGLIIPTRAGSDYLKDKLSEIDLNTALADAQAELDNAKGANIDKAYKKVRVLRNLSNNKIKPVDLLMTYVPVMPLYLRPITINKEENKVESDDINKIYSKIIHANNTLKEGILDANGHIDFMKSGKDAVDAAKGVASVYAAIAGLSGKIESKDIKTGKVLTDVSLGGKNGLFRGKMLAKRVDFSGRSVIGVDPNLKLDEAGLPLDMAKNIYKPFAIKELVSRGYAPNEQEAKKMLKGNSSEIKKVIQDIAIDRPILLNRQPSLHKYSIQALTPVIKDVEDGNVVRSIQLNPLVVTGYNADFDGDCLINSILFRKKIVGIVPKNNWCYNIVPTILNKECDIMPIKEQIRYSYGVINLKDFPKDKLIETKGNKELYTVPGDIEVLTVWEGEKKWLKPESFSIHKNLNMLEIKTSSSRTLQVSDDHSLVTIDENLNYIRAKASVGITLPRSRELVSKKSFENLLDEIPLDIKKEAKYSIKTDKLKLDEKTGYLMGVYIGDGWISPIGQKAYKLFLASDKREIPNEIIKILKEYINEDVYMSNTPLPHDFNGYESYCEKHIWSSATFHNLLSKFVGKKAFNKCLPDFWMHSNENFRWGLLAGLVDTDGTVNIGKAKSKKKSSIYIGYTTTSRTLAYEIVALSHTLNLTASVTITETPAKKECYQVTFTQESIHFMQKHLMLRNKVKAEKLSQAKFNHSFKRNKYTPKLSAARLDELRKSIGSPRVLSYLTEEEKAERKNRRSLYSSLTRIKKEGTAMRLDVAENIISLNLDLFKDPFWKKWSNMVKDKTIEWELLTNIKPIEYITEAYDLTIPPNYTMVTESGLVVYDTMAVHVPISEKAKEEAKKLMMPSQNLINPTDGKMIIELRHEMLLGLYQLTSGLDKPKGTTKMYNDFSELRNDYFMGKVTSRQKVKVPICPHETTAGMAIFNWCIPERIKIIPSVKGGTTGRNFKKPWGKKEVSELFASIYAESEKTNFELLSKTQISLLLDRFKDLGFKASTIGSVSLGADDFIKVKDISNKIEQAAEKGATIENWTKLQNEIEKQIQEGVLQEDNPLQIMMQSGARANPGQIRRMLFTQGVGMDIAKSLKKPIKESLFDGLSTKDYFLLGADSRKGMYDRAVSTSEPGALSRSVWSAVQDVVIKDTDCKTKDYIVMKKSNAPSIKGRIAGADIVGGDGKIICKRNDMITNEVYSKIFADNTIQFVPTRSPLRCKTVSGVCQKCYGAMPGTIQLVKVGSSIGVLASQALGEPVTQMTMNTFHTGGTNSAASLGLPRVKNILQLSTDKQNGAVIAKLTGVVKEIKDTDRSVDVIIEKTPHKVFKDLTGKTPKIKVKVGDTVKAGDFITVGDSNDILMYNNSNGVDIVLTNANPKDLFKNKSLSLGKEQALKETQEYLTNTMQHAFESSNSSFDRRHMETIISKLTQNAKVLDPGDSSLIKGQEIDAAYIKKWNDEHSSSTLAKVVDVKNIKDIVNRVAAENIKDKTGKVLIKKGTLITMDMIPTLSINIQNPQIKVMPKLIEYDYSLKGMNTVGEAGHDNWFSNLGGDNVYRQLARGTSYGQIDKLNDPRSRVMTGKLLNIGEGAKISEDAKHEVGSSMFNFLNDHADKIIKKHGVKK